MKKIANSKLSKPWQSFLKNINSLDDLIARNGEWSPFEWKDEYNEQGTQTDLTEIVKNKQTQIISATKEKSTNTILAKEVKPITEQPNQVRHHVISVFYSYFKLCSFSSPTVETTTSSSVPLEQSVVQCSEITKKQRKKWNRKDKPPNIPFHIGLLNDGSDGLMNGIIFLISTKCVEIGVYNRARSTKTFITSSKRNR